MLRSNSKSLGNHVVSPKEEKERLHLQKREDIPSPYRPLTYVHQPIIVTDYAESMHKPDGLYRPSCFVYGRQSHVVCVISQVAASTGVRSNDARTYSAADRSPRSC